VASGLVRLGKYAWRQPGAVLRYEIELVARREERRALRGGAADEAGLFALLERSGAWGASLAEELALSGPRLEQLKVELFNSWLNAKHKEQIARAIAALKARREELLARRHSLDHLSAAGAGAQARLLAWVGCGLLLRGRRLYTLDALLASRSRLPEAAVARWCRERLPDGRLRALARSPAWREVWMARDSGLFGRAERMTDEQRELFGWSRHYDLVAEHPDCPADDVVACDDALDGWAVVQRRKRESESLRAQVDRGGSGDAFVPVSPENAARIHALNDPSTRAKLQKRHQLVQERGEVKEQDFPDVKFEVALQKGARGR